MKKIGTYLKSMLPLVLMLLIQFGAGAVIMIRYMLLYGADRGAQIYSEETLIVVFLGDLITLGIMGIWYYGAVLNPRKRLGIRKEPSLLGAGDVGLLVMLAVGMQFAVGILLSVWNLISPEMIEEYTDMMESAGIGSRGIFTALAVGIVGPVTEEVVFRGLSIEYLKRTGAAFWAINVLQALYFGIAHLNLVQGAYAFFVGLICGYAVMKYRTLWAGIVFHMAFNLYSQVQSGLLDALEGSKMMDEAVGTAVLLLLLLMGIGFTVFPLAVLRRKFRKAPRAETGYLENE